MIINPEHTVLFSKLGVLSPWGPPNPLTRQLVDIHIQSIPTLGHWFLSLGTLVRVNAQLAR